MASIKSLFDGVGSGSGVAWPTFGILFPTLGLAVGGTVALTLGSVLGCVFIGVGIPVIYLSYKQSKKEDAALQTKLERRSQKLAENIDHYLLTIYDQYLSLNPADNSENTETCYNFFKEKIQEDKLLTENSLLLNIFDMLLSEQEDSGLLKQYIKFKISHKEEVLRRFIPYCAHKMQALMVQPTPKGMLLANAFVGFVGAFGAIAGGSTGVLGLLAGLALFPGLAALPVLGWVILSIAVLAGVFAAVVIAQKAHERFQIKSKSSATKGLAQELDSLSLERSIKLKTPIFINESSDSETRSFENRQSYKPLIRQRPPIDLSSQLSDPFSPR